MVEVNVVFVNDKDFNFGEFKVTPQWMAEHGTPIFEWGEYMDYSHTEVIIDGKVYKI